MAGAGESRRLGVTGNRIMRRLGAGLAASLLALALSACGDDNSSMSAGDGGGVREIKYTPADCTSGTMAISYVDQRQKAFIADVQANKLTPDKFNGFARTVNDEAEKAKASNDWVAYCKAIDAYLTGIGY